MKANTHPAWNHDVTVTCSCGNVFTTGSSLPSLQVDICSACHPFFTGEMRFVDRQGRVDKFNKAVQAAQGTTAVSKRAKKAKKAADQAEALSYRQILQQQKETKKAVAKTEDTPETAATPEQQ